MLNSSIREQIAAWLRGGMGAILIQLLICKLLTKLLVTFNDLFTHSHLHRELDKVNILSTSSLVSNEDKW